MRGAIWLCVFCAGCVAAPPPPAPPAVVDEAPKQVTGIGIRPVLHDRGLAIGQLFPDGPAMAAGLREGDVIVAVDGEPTARWTLERAAARLRAAEGSTVSLVVERGPERFEVGVVRRTVAVPPQRPL